MRRNLHLVLLPLLLFLLLLLPSATLQLLLRFMILNNMPSIGNLRIMAMVVLLLPLLMVFLWHQIPDLVLMSLEVLSLEVMSLMVAEKMGIIMCHRHQIFTNKIIFALY